MANFTKFFMKKATAIVFAAAFLIGLVVWGATLLGGAGQEAPPPVMTPVLTTAPVKTVMPTAVAAAATQGRVAVSPTPVLPTVVTSPTPSPTPRPAVEEASPTLSFLGQDWSQVFAACLGLMGIIAVMVGFVAWIGRSMSTAFGPLFEALGHMFEGVAKINTWTAVTALAVMCGFGWLALQSLLEGISPFSFARAVERDILGAGLMFVAELGGFLIVVPILALLSLVALIVRAIRG